MKASSVKAVLAALHAGNVRFLVAGGLAVNCYGYLRYTKDADLVIELLPANIERAFDALETLGYKPNIPITKEQFSDEPTRLSWIKEKGMTVLQFWSDAHRQTPIDVFVSEPFDFNAELAAAPAKDLPGVGLVPIVSLPTLIRMKEIAGRSQDLIDIEQLRLVSGNENKP